jgi:hypothetical protein
MLNRRKYLQIGIRGIKTKPRQYEYRRGLFFVCHPVFTEGKAVELLISLL